MSILRRDFIASKTRERIAVHLDDGQSVRGVLTAVHRDCLVLEHAKALGDHVETPVDGEVLIPRARVAWIQALPAEPES